jgi:hypothetical protein
MKRRMRSIIISQLVDSTPLAVEYTWTFGDAMNTADHRSGLNNSYIQHDDINKAIAKHGHGLQWRSKISPV